MKISYLLFLLLVPFFSRANNMQITNLEVISIEAVDQFAIIEMDVSWENSWRDAENWDAVWLFIKYTTDDTWHHAELNYVDGSADGHTSPMGGTITTPSDGKGVFLYRSAIGAGTVTFQNLRLRWNYGQDGITDFEYLTMNVFGIEMVYVPQGNFWLGDGSVVDVQGHFEAGTSGNAYQVTSESAIVLGGGAAGSLGNNNGAGMSNNGDFIPAPYNTISMDDYNDTQSQILPAAYPKGYQAFYCMKYELTQGEYVAFINTLSDLQAQNRFEEDPHASEDEAARRYTLTGTVPNVVTTTPHVPAIFLEYFDGAAYADWAGLRPMTELEFEKACRGTLTPVPGEYAWGTTNLNNTFPTIGSIGQVNEGLTAGYSVVSGNAWFNNVNALGAAIRAGVFAANPNNTGRESAGATYWGIMEMSGNCWERAITVGRPEGRAFEGTHGDGELNSLGNATNLDWPGHSGSNGVDDVIGAGYRGAGFDFPSPVTLNMRVSSRRMATSFYYIRYYDDTMRMVRTAP